MQLKEFLSTLNEAKVSKDLIDEVFDGEKRYPDLLANFRRDTIFGKAKYKDCVYAVLPDQSVKSVFFIAMYNPKKHEMRYGVAYDSTAEGGDLDFELHGPDRTSLIRMLGKADALDLLDFIHDFEPKLVYM